MNKVMLAVLTLILFGVISLAPLAAQDQAGGAAPQKAQRVSKPAANPGMWSHKSETLSGTISSVDSEKKLVAVDANGVSFNFNASGAKIKVGGKKAKLDELQKGAQASVTFVATRTGDMAKSIEVQ